MRWVFWILGLFALAVALALALRMNVGTVLVLAPPYRIELSLNLFALGFVAALGLGYLLLRFVFGAIALPQRVREYRAARAKDNARSALIDALQAFFEGRYGRAEKAAAVLDQYQQWAATNGIKGEADAALKKWLPGFMEAAVKKVDPKR